MRPLQTMSAILLWLIILVILTGCTYVTVQTDTLSISLPPCMSKRGSMDGPDIVQGICTVQRSDPYE